MSSRIVQTAQLHRYVVVSASLESADCHCVAQVGVVAGHQSVTFGGVTLLKSSIGDRKVVEQDCRCLIEALAPSDPLVTLDKSPGTSCCASPVCLH